MREFYVKPRLYLSGLLILGALLILAVSCYGGAEPAPAPAPGPTASATEVTIQGFAFRPNTITVPVGTTVTWMHKDSAPHTVTSREPLFDSGTIRNGDTFSYTFDQPGTYAYYCSIHPSMTAEIIVE